MLISAYNYYKQERHAFEYSVAELREILALDKKYKQIGQLQNNVLDIAMKEINLKTRMVMSYKTHKTGREITDIIFYVDEKSKKKTADAASIEAIDKNNECAITICAKLDGMGIENSVDQCRQLAKAYENNLERFDRNLAYVITRMDINNFVAYLITIAKNDLTL